MIPNLRDLPPDNLPLRCCPYCHGYLAVENWHELFELVCVSCARTAAIWLPGMTAWKLGSRLIDDAATIADKDAA